MNLVSSQAPPSTPIGLPSTRPSTTPSTIGSRRSPAPPLNWTPALSRAKNGTATAELSGAIRCSSRSAGGPGLAVVRDHPRQQSEYDAGDRGVHPALVHGGPGDHGQRQVDQRAAHAQPLKDGVRREGRCGHQQTDQVQRRGVEDRDHHDHDEVVDHREGQQEPTQLRRQFRADHGEHGQCERDVGRCRHRPAPQVVGPPVEHHEDQGRHRDSAARCEHRDRRVSGTPQRAHEQLPLELEPGDEEEHRQGAVGGPLLDVERPDLPGAELLVGGVVEVGPGECHQSGHQGDRPTDGLGTEQVTQERGLALVGVGEETAPASRLSKEPTGFGHLRPVWKTGAGSVGGEYSFAAISSSRPGPSSSRSLTRGRRSLTERRKRPPDQHL